MTFKSYSQAGQDKWVYDRLGSSGFFLDLGCNHPIEINNTYALEEMGWKGFLVDSDEHCVRLCRATRFEQVYQADLSKPHDFWVNLPSSIDYLSLDVDNSTLDCLKLIPFATHSFKVATIEHDSYRFGNGPRDAIRTIMLEQGYRIAVADVAHEDCVFEDWWYRP